MNQNLNPGHLHHQHQHSHSHLQQQQHRPQAPGCNAGNENSNVLVYINHPGDDHPNRSGGMTIHNCSMSSSSSSWIKHQQHPPSPAGATLPMSSTPPIGNNNCAASTTSSYGAYSQQQTFYPAENPYDDNAVADDRLNPNFNPSEGFYPNDTTSTSSDYYQNNPNQFQSYDSTKNSNCGSDEGNNSSNLNFFSCGSGFYPSSNTHNYNHQPQEYQNHPGGGKYFRNNYNSGQIQDSSAYFASVSQSRMALSAYGHQQNTTPSEFRVDHSSNSQPPFRRNSIESFSTEPGESAYNSKYGTFHNSSGQFSSGSKRDTFVSTSWSNTGSSGHGHGSCQGYFLANQPTNSHNHTQSHRHYFNSTTGNFSPEHQNCGSTTLPGSGGGNYGQQHHQQFVQNEGVGKSCSFEDSGRLGFPSHVGINAYRAAPLKQRSLSLQYPRSEQFVNRNEQQQHLFKVRTPNYSQNTNKSVPVVTEIRRCSDSGSSPASQSGGENGSDRSSNSNNASPVPEDHETLNCRTNIIDREGENYEDNGDGDCGVDAFIRNGESSDPSQSNLSELNNNNNCDESSSGSNRNGRNQEDEPNKNDVHNVISTTTNTAESTCRQVQLDCDISNENDNDLSNSSSLALFDSITLMNTLTSSPLSDNGEDSLSGTSCSESGEHGQSRHQAKSPQKISKRSFSEADKDLVINTSAITAALAFGIRRNISVPVGWKREMKNNSHILYISPSSTKLRSWEELKNYVSSDGTCKCGLNCPLWLEHTFSFDPKVRNTCDDEKESLMNLNPKEVKMETRFCCNHKRKTPSNDDYPLISSTRDDLGDCIESDERKGKSSAKKRRISGAHGVCPGDTSKYKGLGSLITTPKTPSPAPQGQNVSVPFSQQSPDTTTQTPQRDMSPASSVSSERSSVSTHSTGNRSNNTTPTPVLTKTSPTTTSLPSKGQGQYEFAWPSAPSTSTGGMMPNRTATPPFTTTTPNNAGTTKKPNISYHNYIESKPRIGGTVRRNTPCPNIDVRQIPLEQNQPPPRPNQLTKDSLLGTISINPASSHVNQNQNPTVSFIPVTSGTPTQADHSIANLNTGYSISPIIPNVNVSTVSFGSVNNPTYQFANILPMQMPVHRVISTSTANFNPNMLIQQSLPRSITISMVEQQEKSLSTNGGLSSLPTSTMPSLTKVEVTNITTESLDRISEKSPLQLVQDVVDRFHTGSGESSNADNGLPSCKNDSLSVSTTEAVTKSLNHAEQTPQVNEEIKSTELKMTSKAYVQRTMAITSNATLTAIDTDAERQKKPLDGITKFESGLTSISIFPASSSFSVQPALVSNSSSNNTNACITTTSMSANVPIMAHAPLLSCTNNTGGFNLSNLSANGNSLILQQQPDQNSQNSLFTTSAGGGGQPIRYPLFQTLQPIILNSNGTPSSLIISPQGQGTTEHQSFIQIDQNSHHQATANMYEQQTSGTTMMIDPSMCGGMGQTILCGGPKKKKKRLSKKQQQQQAQLQLQQQLLLQQLHQQVQAQQVHAAAQQQIPLLFPPSFSLGQQGFSLQPMNMNMNFFPTPTILTLPNIILNPADGTLFIQQPSGTPLSATTATAAGTNLKISNQYPMQTIQPQQNLIAPKKDNGGILEVVRLNSNETGVSSDDSRQNATPDSSTNDCQLGLMTPSTPNSITVSLPLSSNTNLPNKKLPLKSKAVSSSSKRILLQKQILPKIDSTTQSVENT